MLLASLFACVSAAWADSVVITDIAQLTDDMSCTVSTSRGGWAVNQTGDNFGSTNDHGFGATVDPTNTQHLFQFKKIDEKFYLYSVHAAKYVSSDRSLTEEAKEAIEFLPQGDNTFLVKLNGSFINLGGSSQMIINNYGTPDAGNKVTITAQIDAKAKLSLLVNEVMASASFGKLPLQVDKASASYYLSGCGSADGNEVAHMIDGNKTTFYGSPWQYAIGQEHYWQIDLGESVTLSEFVFNYVTRANGTNSPSRITVAGSSDGTTFDAVLAIIEELPAGGGMSYKSSAISNPDNYRYLRFQTYDEGGYSPGEGETTLAIAEFSISDTDEENWSADDKALKAAVDAAKALLVDENATEEDYEAAYGTIIMIGKEKPVYPFTVTTDDANPVLYAIKSGRGDAYWYTYDDTDGKISLSSYEGAQTQFWYFKEVLTADYEYALQLFPYLGEGKAMSYENTSSAAAKIVAKTLGTQGWTNLWLVATTDGKAPYGLQTYDKKNYLSNNGGTANKMGMWNAAPNADTGTAMYFVTPAEALQNVIDAAEAMLAGEGTAVGYYTATSIDNLEAAIATAKSNLENDNFAVADLNAAMAAVQVVLPEAGKFYQIVTGYKAFPETKAIYSTGEALAWKTLDAADKAFYWSITPNNEGTSFTFCNVADGKFANGLTMVDADAVTTTLKSLAPGEFNIVSNGNTWHASGHVSGAGQNGNIINYGGGANGASSWMIVEVEHPDLAVAKAVLQSKIDELKAIQALGGTNPGCYKEVEVAKLAEPIAAAEVVMEAGSAEPAVYTEALAALNEAIEAVDLGMIPVTAGLYRIVSAASAFSEEKGITCFAKDEFYRELHYPGWATANVNDPLQYWTLEEAENGAFYIKAAYEGNYITSATTMTTEAKAVDFASLGSAQFKMTLVGESNPLHANGWNWQGTTQSGLVQYNTGANEPSAWRLIAVNDAPEFSFELNVGATGYATLMLAYDAEIPADVTCYTVAVADNKAVLTAVEGDVLPAKTAVIVEAEADTYTFASAQTEAGAVEGNELMGTLYPKFITAAENTNYYVVATKEGNTGFYKAALNKNENTAFLNNANKVYLPVEVAAGEEAPAMFVLSRGGEDEDTTGIDQLISNGEVVIYDLAGRRVEKMEKGIYIVNGKKVVK